jgi:D-alanyl-D-alanine carboxypeptidase (penicillin-binding protein 5/6)
MAKTSPKNKIKKISILSLGLAVLLLAIFFFLPGQNIYQTSYFPYQKPLVASVPLELPSPAPYPTNNSGVPSPSITAQAIIIKDLPSGVILFQKNQHLRLAPASITKVITALVALDWYKLDDVLTVRSKISEGRLMGLVPGDQLTFENLLYGILVHSGNDAAYTLADNYPGGLSKFVEAMNLRGNTLSLEDTNFTNPAGFEDPNHFSTARDIALFSEYALKNPTIARIISVPEVTVPDANFSKFFHLENVNQLLGKVPGVLGLKTGWTEEAGECLVTGVTKNNHKILIVVLNSQDRFGETEKLIDWVFTNFSWQAIAPSTQP